MLTKTLTATATETDDGYAAFEERMARKVAAIAGPVFTTDADPELLWVAYLDNLPEERRRHYACHCCRRFIQQYGGLVTLDPETGVAVSALWEPLGAAPEDNWPPLFWKATYALRVLVRKAQVTGVFLSTSPVWGTPQTGPWTHLCGRSANVFKSRTLTAGQTMADKRQDFGILNHGLADYPAHVAVTAEMILQSDALYRSEKAEAVAKWFAALHKAVDGKRGSSRDNVVWHAVATAPPGFCHVRSTVISTLFDDLKAGVAIEAIKKRWADKLHPLQYQRPQAAPTGGQLDAAEKLVEKLGLTKAFDRRYATLKDVRATLWEPPAVPEKVQSGGVFSHLRERVETGRTKVDLPEQRVTWAKFHRDVLPLARQLEVKVPARGPFYGLVTATDPNAPPIIQWDGLDGHPRNPVSWYFYYQGSPASRWGLTPNAWAPVTAVFLSPNAWQAANLFAHQGEQVFFALAGCRDSQGSELCLFPEILKADLRGIRATIEAHSKRGGRVTGKEAGDANGIAFQSQNGTPVTVRAHTAGGTATYTIDRWE